MLANGCFLLRHPIIAHDSVPAGVGLDLGPVQLHPTQFDRAGFQNNLQNLIEDPGKRLRMDLAKI
jgi:hypothetical protein